MEKKLKKLKSWKKIMKKERGEKFQKGNTYINKIGMYPIDYKISFNASIFLSLFWIFSKLDFISSKSDSSIEIRVF